MKLQTIVVAYDDTPASRRALEKAADLVELCGARIVVTSVAPVLAHIDRGMGAPDPNDSPEQHRTELADARKTLARRRLDADFVPAIGEPVDTIVELAEERDADLIVIGADESSLLARLFDGDVSGRLSRRARRDVLIVQ